MEDPSAAELDTLLKDGAPGGKKLVSWFRDKVISNMSLLHVTNAQNNF